MNTRQALTWLVVAGAVVALVVWGPGMVRWYRHNVEWGVPRETVVDSLSRDLQPGMPLEEVTAYLRRRGIAFTVQSGDDGPLITGIERESTSDGRITETREHQIEFDAQHRLRAFRLGSTIRVD